jgi:hypothetical protein
MHRWKSEQLQRTAFMLRECSQSSIRAAAKYLVGAKQVASKPSIAANNYGGSLRSDR